jgi:rhodanese-related sulfurtransferase
MNTVLEAPPAAALAADTFADSVSPQEAWALFSTGRALLVDVRTKEELTFVGQVPGTLHVPWATGTSLTRNPRFARELEAKVGNKHQRVLLLCRSGKRSALALDAARKAGFTQASNVSEGFEGELDASQQRGHGEGWRFHELPWTQS